MTNSSQCKIALVAGFAFLIMAIAAFFAIYFVFENLKVSGNATINNIMAKAKRSNAFHNDIFLNLSATTSNIPIANRFTR